MNGAESRSRSPASSEALREFSGYDLVFWIFLQDITWIWYQRFQVIAWKIKETNSMLSAAKRLARRRLDERLNEFRRNRPSPPAKGWLRAIRDALGMSGAQFSRRLGISWQSMDDLERSEANGTIGLETLRRAAAALDCTVIYAVVPNRTLETMVADRARQLALRALARVDHTMILEDQQVQYTDREELIEDYIREHLRDRDLWSEQ